MKESADFVKNITFACARHQDTPRLKMTGGEIDLMFRCKNYYPGYRREGDRPCRNYLRKSDMTIAAYHLFQKLQEMEFNGINVNLKGHRWEYGGIRYVVLKHDAPTNRMLVSFDNTAEDASDDIKGEK